MRIYLKSLAARKALKAYIRAEQDNFIHMKNLIVQYKPCFEGFFQELEVGYSNFVTY